MSTLYAVPGRPGDYQDDLPAADAHRAAMSLFGDLAGQRAEHKILFRTESAGRIGHHHGPLMLVRSTAIPERLPVNAVSITEQDAPAVGAQVLVQLTWSPVRRVRSRESHWPVAEALERLAERLAGAVTTDRVLRHDRRVIGQSTRRDKVRMALDHVVFLGTVVDPAELEHLRTEGVGRAKNYGAGLMTFVAVV